MKRGGSLIIFLVFILLYNNLLASTHLVRVQDIVIEGNKRTQSTIILRELTFQVNDFVDSLEIEKVLEASKSNIINTNLFLEVDIQYFISHSDEMSVLIHVKENWYWSVLPHFNLADRSFNEWWYDRNKDLRRTTYGIDIQHRNFTGNADQLTAYLHFGFTPLQQVSYFEPYLDKKKRLGLKINFFHRTRNSLPFRTEKDKLEFYSDDNHNLRQIGGSGYLRYRKNHKLLHFLSFGYSNNYISDSIATINPNYFGLGKQKLDLLTLGYEFWADYRDIRQYPLNGEIFVLSLNQYMPLQGSFQSDIKLKFNIFRPLNGKLYWESGITGKTSFTQNQTYFLYQGLGYGREVVRGYDLYVLDGSSFVLNRNTIKYKVFERKYNLENFVKVKQFSTLPITIYPIVFIDYGYVKNKIAAQTMSNLSNKHLIGGGFGIDLVTFYNTNFNISYSFNQLKEKRLFLSFGRYF